MRHRQLPGRRAEPPRIVPPLSGDIVAVLRRALHDHEYAAAEHLLQALEALARQAGKGAARGRCRHALDIGYLEVARALQQPTSAHRGRSSADPEPGNG